MKIFNTTKKEIYNSGSTLSFAKIYRNLKTKKIKIKIEWLGDSPILVFINNELIFESQLHNATNETEIQRLKNKGVFVNIKEVSYGFEVLSEDRIISKDSKYILFKNKDLLAMSRSLGHDRITGVETQKHIIECNTDDEVKVIIFSDGVGDMLNMGLDLDKLKKYSAEEIVELAEKRWKQEWFYGKEGNIKEYFEKNDYDDCCCAIWWQKNNNI
jgi:serine/threonine protein phosphatase PrpC